MKNVTIRDVANAANVSIATVSRVLRGKDNVSEETRRQIAQAIRSTGYRISPELDRSLLAEDGLIYFIMRSASVNKYSQLLCQEMIRAADHRGLRLIAANVEARNRAYDEDLLACLEQAQRLGVRGVIQSGFTESSMSPAVIGALQALRLPVVMINRSFSDYSFCRVLTGSERGAFMAAQHMLEKGRRHLLMLTYPGHHGKQAGFQRAVSERTDGPVFSQVLETKADSLECCKAVLDTALQNDPLLDGILCCSDEQAARVLQALHQKGKKVPDDLLLIGFNDNLAPFLSPPIPSVRVPLAEIAAAAIDLFLEQEKAQVPAPAKSVLLDPRLILR